MSTTWYRVTSGSIWNGTFIEPVQVLQALPKTLVIKNPKATRTTRVRIASKAERYWPTFQEAADHIRSLLLAQERAARKDLKDAHKKLRDFSTWVARHNMIARGGGGSGSSAPEEDGPVTRAQLEAYAAEQDGSCKVMRPPGGPTTLHPPDEELGYRFDWDYFMSDEPDGFDFERFRIAQ